MPRFYADENFDYPSVQLLRAMGHDVLTVQEAGRRGDDDARVLDYATEDDRIVLTHDRRDFERLHLFNANHKGIVSCTLDVAAALAMRIQDAVAAAGTVAGQHLRVNLPP